MSKSTSSPLHWLTLLAVLCAPVLVVGQTAPILNPLSENVLRPGGQNIVPIYDGWFPNDDGSFTLCFGYFSLNTEESVDVPLGPENRIEPAAYDGSQPTHFDPVPNSKLTGKYRHYWCVFTVEVPSDFGAQDILWTLTTQGDELSVPGSLTPLYILDENYTAGRGAEAPRLSLSDGPANSQGRRGLWEGPKVVRVGEALPLTARISHPEAGTWLSWTLHQGPAAVSFSESELRVDKADGVSTSTVTFAEPGSYVIRLQAINDTERKSNPTYGFEFLCCWTNGFIKVDVVD